MLKRYRQRSEALEWLDQPPIPRSELDLNLKDLARVNRSLGGHRATIKGVEELLPEGSSTCSVVDVGCGGGDTLRAIDRFGAQKGIEFDMTGVDPLPEALAYAEEHWGGERSPEWRQASFQDLEDEARFDIATSSLFCHHLYGDELLALLRKLDRIARFGVVINDLHRHPLAYYGIRVLSTLLSDSKYLQHDAPLSVLKGFRRRDWERILEEAGFSEYRIRWIWAFRHCIVIPKAAHR
jgi:2-polyprenyl-3-methyl-5-hydroxy-6-metoxy-1,4-benzoquinol methylase